jgi:glucose/arabinose dehydrogenase
VKRHLISTFVLTLLCVTGHGFSVHAQALKPQTLKFNNGRSLRLNLPANTQISLAAQGLKRVRFMAIAPDKRLFVTDMFDKSDNQKGSIWILDGFDSKTGRFAKKQQYLTKLRNPNSIAFYTDPNGKSWLYVALTHQLVRYEFKNGDVKPRSEPEVLAKYPDYGLSYKYGGWHLTRTIAFDKNGRAYISVGSSQNAGIEKEEIRATISSMDADGKNQKIIAKGLRNAVGLKFVGEELFCTNMGADHLGINAPNDTLYRIEENRDYGWPTVYVKDGKNYRDPKFANEPKRVDPAKTPLPYAVFAPHSSPLGLEYFDQNSNFPALKNQFLVALHGSGFPSQKRGYSVAIVPKSSSKTPHVVTKDFITGFQVGRKVLGRPCDILRYQNGFLITDDLLGAVYFVRPK